MQLFKSLRSRPIAVGKIALVTANFGGIDEVYRLPTHPLIDAFYFTDADTKKDAPADVAESWGGLLTPNFPRHDFSPRLRARYFKHQIHRLDVAANYRWLVWADSCLQFFDIGFLFAEAQRLARMPPHQRVLVVPHPDRQTVEQEYLFIKNEIERGSEYLGIRYSQEKMLEQMEYFADNNFDVKAPLFCGTIWMMENSDLNQRCWDAWWDQNLRFGMMDQLSFPIMLEKFGIEPQRLPVVLWENEFFQHNGHRKLA